MKPPGSARRVDEASKAARLSPTSISRYEIFLCRGVSRGRENTGFTGRKGCAVEFGMIGSRSAFTLGAGAEGREATRGESFVALSEATAGESLNHLSGSSIWGMAQIKSTA